MWCFARIGHSATRSSTTVSIGRIDLPAVEALLDGLGGVVDNFVEAASALLLQAGQASPSIRTERFEPTGK